MSCGLGAIVLVFMLVKDNPERAEPETALLQADLSRLEQLHQELRSGIQALSDQSRAADSRLQSVSQELSRLQDEANKTRDAADAKRQRLAALEETITQTNITTQSDVIEIPKAGQETYLIGLKVEGQKIGLLIDVSASMTDETLLAVIRRKNSSDLDKKAGPKWRRTKEIVSWLLARLPDRSQVSVVTYNEKAGHLGGQQWKPSRDPSSLEGILRDLEAVVPSGPTNLQAGLKAIYAMSPTHLYLVTDGLPTQGSSGYSSLNPFAACSALWGRSSNISGACRAKLFRHTIQDTWQTDRLPVNVILLPIEGDPGAAFEYWQWAALSGGLLITPAETWP
ncbi:MAG: VWA domain-containing protein [Desulfurellaceae bacterium]|nr:VWA domain-containing protein [Desulfurellaceae bacterium]